MTQRYVYLRRERPKEPGEDVTWDDLLGHLLFAKRKKTPKYQYDLKNSLTRMHNLLVGVGVAMPHQITPRFARQALAVYEATGVSDLTVNHMATKLMTEFTLAWREDIFAVDKLAALQKEKSGKPKHTLVKMEEIDAIVTAIYDSWSPEHAPASRFRSEEARRFFAIRDVCMTMFLPETGCRVGEMSRTKMTDIDLKSRKGVFLSTKNGEDRPFYLTDDFAQGILTEWLNLRNGMDTLTDFLFVTETGLQINPYTWGRQWDQYRQRAGIERRIRRHDLRHFSSTTHDSVDLQASKALHGHLSDTAHDVYSHITEARRRAVHDKASPVGPINARLRGEAEAREAAAVAPAKEVRRKIYTKPK